jgi:hypothetical protein
MPHRAKNKRRARHHTHPIKAANLSKPAVPISIAANSEVVVAETPKKPTRATAKTEAAVIE